MAEDNSQHPTGPALFTLDLGQNGGVLAPSSLEELADWIEREFNAWKWLANLGQSGVKAGVDHSIQGLRSAHKLVRQAIQSEAQQAGSGAQRAEQIQASLQDTYISKALPHSTSPLGHRISQIRERNPLEAMAYLFSYLPSSTNEQFDARDTSSWRGFLMGVGEQTENAGGAQQQYQVALESFAETRAKAERALAEKTESYNALHRDFVTLRKQLADMAAAQKASFEEMLKAKDAEQETNLANHRGVMTNLQQVFREQMTLRAPVEYWETRQSHHETRTKVLGRWSFGAMTVLTLMLGLIAWWVLHNLSADGKPEVWRASVLVLVGVLGVWATRLLVRMFLSHIHLATDAAERVVMVKTYLSLMEGNNAMSDEDRRLVLQSLFRPASDGIVKDEGLPHPALEMLTKLSGR